MTKRTVIMTVEIKVETRNPEEHAEDWEIEGAAKRLIRGAFDGYCIPFNASPDHPYEISPGDISVYNTVVSVDASTVLETGSRESFESLTYLWNNQIREIHESSNSWHFIKANKELATRTGSRSWSLPEVTMEQMVRMKHAIRLNYNEQSSLLLNASLVESICSSLQEASDDNLYTIPEPVTPEPF